MPTYFLYSSSILLILTFGVNRIPDWNGTQKHILLAKKTKDNYEQENLNELILDYDCNCILKTDEFCYYTIKVSKVTV